MVIVMKWLVIVMEWRRNYHGRAREIKRRVAASEA
jgi:hypothetical protein